MNKINQDFKERAIAQKAQQLGLSYINLMTQPINPDVFTYIDYAQSQKLQALPFTQHGYRLGVAVVNPELPELKAYLAELAQKQNFQIHRIIYALHYNIQ